MRLGKRIFAAFIGFIIIPLFVLGTVFYLSFQNIAQKQFSEQTELSLKAIGQNINNMIKEANYFSDFWVTTEDSVESVEQSIGADGAAAGTGGSAGAGEGGTSALSGESGQGAQAASVESDEYEALLEKTKLRNRLLLTYPSIKSVTLYRSDGRMIHVNFNDSKPPAFEQLRANPLFPQVLRRNGAPVWTGPYEDSLLTGDDNLFTQVRVLLDMATMKSKGILLIRFQMSELDRIFSSYSTGNGHSRRFLIVGRGGKVVFDSDNRLQGRSAADIMDARRPVDLTRDFQSRTMMFDGKKSFVSVHSLSDLSRLGLSDWTLVTVTSWAYLSGDMANVVRWIVVFTAASLACALLFNLMFVRRTVRVIVRVVQSMRRVERGDLSARLPAAGNDEAALLATGFNSLVHRVSELLEDVKREQRRKRRAEMMLLQAQIKPHFLFNALESINILAVQNEGRKVSKMVQRLANILRITIQQQEEIRIEQELEHVRSYLEIQKYRFEDLFEYDIDVPEALLSCRILKLTLQPLVENCIQHGFEGIDYLGRIRIWAEEEGGRIAFYVADNGIGIPDDRLARIAARGAASLEDMAEERPETGERRGLGVANVADRLRIHYGPGFGLMLCSAPGQGTRIKCVVPKTAGREAHEAESAAG
jgi:sensor histidine kinase YesM